MKKILLIALAAGATCGCEDVRKKEAVASSFAPSKGTLEWIARMEAEDATRSRDLDGPLTDTMTKHVKDPVLHKILLDGWSGRKRWSLAWGEAKERIYSTNESLAGGQSFISEYQIIRTVEEVKKTLTWRECRGIRGTRDEDPRRDVWHDPQ